MAVYVMGCEDSRLVKIGHSNNPERRLDNLRKLPPFPVTVLWQSEPEHGDAMERRLHDRFRAYRCYGEWFDFGDVNAVLTVVAAVEQLATRQYDREKRLVLQVMAEERPDVAAESIDDLSTDDVVAVAAALRRRMKETERAIEVNVICSGIIVGELRRLGQSWREIYDSTGMIQRTADRWMKMAAKVSAV